MSQCNFEGRSSTQKTQQKYFTPAQSSDCPAYGRKPLYRAAFAWPQGWQALGHTVANTLIMRGLP